MNRRGFLKLTLFAAAAVTIPVPDFLLPKSPKTGDGLFTAPETATYELSGGALTQEMIEKAYISAMNNHGAPDQIWMDEDTYNGYAKHIISKGGNALFSWELGEAS